MSDVPLLALVEDFSKIFARLRPVKRISAAEFTGVKFRKLKSMIPRFDSIPAKPGFIGEPAATNEQQ